MGVLVIEQSHWEPALSYTGKRPEQSSEAWGPQPEAV